ncbi:MAG: hypothetical protein KA419_17285 [Acidobacteria bacterium]|nr:hypothetical protein [Acidobacteriota bacterium]
MKYRTQLIVLLAFAVSAPLLIGGCSISSILGRKMSEPGGPDFSLRGMVTNAGEVSIEGWFGGTLPRQEEAVPGSVTLQDLYKDEHRNDGSFYRSRTTIKAPGVAPAGFVGVAILQVPAGCSVFTAAYNDYHGHVAPLTVYPNIPSLPLTGSTSLNAETGQEFAVVRVPDGLVPDYGSPEQWFEISLDFYRPSGQTGPMALKGIVAARYEFDGQTYYLPLCPAVTRIEDVPVVTVQAGSSPAEITIPPAMAVPPPGGTAVYDLGGGFTYRQLYFPRLAFEPGVTDEGYGFVNVGAQADQVEFRAYGADGSPVGTPNTLAWPAGGQGAYQADGLFGLTGAATAWATAKAGKTGMRGFFLSQLFGPSGLAGLDGAPVFSETFAEGYVPRVQGTNGYTTRIMVANPGLTPVNVTFTGLTGTGTVAGSTVPVPALGVHTADLGTIFAGKAPFDGALKIVANEGGVVANANIRYGSAAIASVNAVDVTEARKTLFASHVVSFTGVFGTRLHVVNPTATDHALTLTPYAENGTALGPPVNLTIGANRALTLDESQMGLPAGSNVNGWLKVSSPDVTPEPAFLGAVTFGHPGDHHYESTLPLQADGLWDLYFAQVATGNVGGIHWVSGLAIVNPSPTASAQVTITVHKSDGTVNGTPAVRTLAPGEKYVRELAAIEGIGTLENQASGYVHVHADQPVMAFELFYNQQLDFISAVTAQR